MSKEILSQKIAEAAKTWDDVHTVAKYGRRVLLWGPPGTGKSYAGIKTAKGDVCRVYLTLDTPGAEIRGHYLPSESGGFAWHDGPATKAWKNGERLVIDEIDAASGETLTLLLAYLDDIDTAALTLPTNETIRPAGDFTCVATTNQKPSTLPEALLDRFDAVIEIKTPHPDAFASNAWADQDLAEAAKRNIFLNVQPPKSGAGRPVGLRAFRAIDGLVRQGLDLEHASRLTLGAETGQWLCSAIKLQKAENA